MLSLTHRTLVFALLLVAAASLAFATGAAVVDGPADDIADGDLAIQPTDSPNGRYAYVTDDDEIAIDVSASNPNIRDPDFEGVNVDSTATIDDVFTITYTGDQYAHVWIGYPNESVTFVADGQSIEGEANNVTLAPNQTVTVGLELDTRGAAAGTRLGADQFSIEAKLAEPDDATTPQGGAFEQTSGGGPSITVKAPDGNRREFGANGMRRGGTVRFRVDGMHLDGSNVTLDGVDLEGVRTESVELDAQGSRTPVESGGALSVPTTPRPMAYLALEHEFASDDVDRMTIRFSVSREHLNATGIDPEDVTLYRQTDAGDWAEKPVEVVDDDMIALRDLPADRVHFRATTTDFLTFAVAERVPRFDVTEATVAPQAIETGETATVTATVRNGGGAAGERAVTLTAAGDPVATESVALAPNETTTVTLGATFDTAGAYDLAVGGTPVGTLTVGDPAADGSASSTSADDPEGGAGPTEEPSGIDFVQLGGLFAAFLMAMAALALYRRMPRS